MKRNTEITCVTYQPSAGDPVHGWHVNVPHWPPVVVTAAGQVFRVGDLGSITPRDEPNPGLLPTDVASAVIDYLRQEPKDTVEDNL